MELSLSTLKKHYIDTIDHTTCLRKLGIYGVHQSGIKFFRSYLSIRSQRCCVHGVLSEAVKFTCGVPRGSNLGPLLFLIYINDLPNCLKRASPKMFADDTNISIAAEPVTELESIINSELKNLHQWLIADRLSLNDAKTEFLIIGSRQRLMIHNSKQINIEIDKAVMMFKILNDLTPDCLLDLFEYNLRDSENDLFVPKPRTNYAKRSFSYSGAVLWHELPQNMRALCSLKGGLQSVM